MSQVKKKCRRESFQVFLHVSKDIRFPSPSFDFILKKKSPKILIATLFTELYKSWFLGLLNELQKILRNFFIELFYWKVFCWVCIHVHLRSKTLLMRNIIRLPWGNLYRISLTLPVITPTLPLLLFCWNWSLVCRKFGQWLTNLCGVQVS